MQRFPPQDHCQRLRQQPSIPQTVSQPISAGHAAAGSRWANKAQRRTQRAAARTAPLFHGSHQTPKICCCTKPGGSHNTARRGMHTTAAFTALTYTAPPHKLQNPSVTKYHYLVQIAGADCRAAALRGCTCGAALPCTCCDYKPRNAMRANHYIPYHRNKHQATQQRATQ
jgi:hypothetical protein